MKAGLAARRKQIQVAITESRKQLRLAEKEKRRNDANKIEREIDRLVWHSHFYAPGVTPIQFSNGLVMYRKLLEDYIKKLPSGFIQSVSFTEDPKALELNHKNGKLTLYDISEYYQDLKLPKGEVVLDDLGINIV